jgi:hypothetical protein
LVHIKVTLVERGRLAIRIARLRHTGPLQTLGDNDPALTLLSGPIPRQLTAETSRLARICPDRVVSCWTPNDALNLNILTSQYADDLENALMERVGAAGQAARSKMQQDATTMQQPCGRRALGYKDQ